MKEKLNFLNQDQITALQNDYEVLTFPNDFDLVYENQIPTTGIALVEGQIDFIKRSKTQMQINQSCLLGINELLNGQPVKQGCRIKASSKIILLGKSEILALLKDQKSKLFNLIKSLKLEA